ncbi:hypothetical protein [Aliarcobacter cryaerophilus]|jgi:hypothetical protein|uniref:hypothetical protein n=1 Tax=Aliarcobacter cryaerophilus TaxID=28198 RepID=UPI0021B3A39E|nr:hypothetical protein [Aliarcobacter cryaerophilus]MCT7464483.1 hypothetical protein [Aliarcobacter cryaerophilus]
MLKVILVLCILFSNVVLGNILVMGDSKNGYKCDNQIKYPIGIENCNKIEALEDINICYFKDMSLGCKKIFKNESYLVGETDNNVLNFERLLSFNNNTKLSFGIKRFGNELKETGMPIGSLLKQKKDINIKLDKNYNIKLTISSGNKLILNTSFKSNIINISKDILDYDKTYLWKLYLDEILYQDSFDIVSQSIQKDLEEELKTLLINIVDKKSEIFIKSLIYDQYGLNYDRNQILKEVN